ncbi:unnamed protein product [Ectocarpus sp. 6 AP-2014]
MSPNEHAIKNIFFSEANTSRVHGSAQAHVHASISYPTVVDAMHKEFTVGLGGREAVNVDTLNRNTINTLHDSHQKHLHAVAHSREVGFEKSRIPTNFLPRASFELQTDRERSGKTQIVLR